MRDFKAGCQRDLNQGKRWEASRATQFLSKSSASRCIGESVSRLIGVSAHRLAGLAICEDFMTKMGDSKAGCQKKLNQGKRWEASRATQFLTKSSASR